MNTLDSADHNNYGCLKSRVNSNDINDDITLLRVSDEVGCDD